MKLIINENNIPLSFPLLLNRKLYMEVEKKTLF